MGFCFSSRPAKALVFFSAEIEHTFSRRNDVAFRGLAGADAMRSVMPTVNESAVNATLVDDCAGLLIWRNSHRKYRREYRPSASPRHMK